MIFILTQGYNTMKIISFLCKKNFASLLTSKTTHEITQDLNINMTLLSMKIHVLTKNI